MSSVQASLKFFSASQIAALHSLLERRECVDGSSQAFTINICILIRICCSGMTQRGMKSLVSEIFKTVLIYLSMEHQNLITSNFSK